MRWLRADESDHDRHLVRGGGACTCHDGAIDRFAFALELCSHKWLAILALQIKIAQISSPKREARTPGRVNRSRCTVSATH